MFFTNEAARNFRRAKRANAILNARSMASENARHLAASLPLWFTFNIDPATAAGGTP
jgi:hypothetical protein